MAIATVPPNTPTPQPETAPPEPGPHAPPFADIREARRALRRQVFAIEKPLTELGDVAETIAALSYASIEAGSAVDTSPRAFAYLSGRLEKAVKRLEKWQDRARPLVVIVGDNDLDALANSHGFKDRLAETYALLGDEP